MMSHQIRKREGVKFQTLDCGANAELGVECLVLASPKHTCTMFMLVSRNLIPLGKKEVAGYFNNKFLGELGFFSMKVALYLEDFL